MVALLPGMSAGAASSGATTSASYSSTLAGASEAPMYPSGLTWDTHLSRLVVADTGYNRITVFDPTKCSSDGSTCTPILTFGSLGSGSGDFNTPRDVAVDGNSNIYVADAGNSRIEAFSSTGSFLWQAGGLGTCASCLNVPIGISYDATTNEVLVADTGHSLVKAYAAVGGVGTAFPAGQFIWASPGSVMKSPREARRGPDGEIWVADYHDDEVRAFQCTCATSSSDWHKTWNKQLGDGLKGGHAIGELNAPYNVVFSADGNTAYVADTGNERVSLFDIQGCSGQCATPTGCSTTSPPSGCVYGQRVTGTTCPMTSGTFPNGSFQALRRVTIDGNGDIWAADFWGSGIHEFSTTSPAPNGGAVLGEIDGRPAPAPGFAQAYGVSVGPDGTAYAVDRLNQRIEEFEPPANAPSTYVACEGRRGTAKGEYSWPEGIAVAPDKTVWVADTRNGRLQQFAADIPGKPLLVYGTTGSGSGQFNYPEGVTVDATGTVWVADTKNNRIDSFIPSTLAFSSYGTRGTGTSSCEFINPQGVAVVGSDVYVADTGNNRIDEVAISGGTCTPVAQSAQLDAPQGIAVAPDGTVWVANTGTSATDVSGNDIVQLSSNLASQLYSFGGPGSGSTKFDLPHSLAFSPDGATLFVADTYNNRVQEFVIQ